MEKSNTGWQAFIDEVNAILTNPTGGGCTPIEEIQPPDPCEKITVADTLQEVVDRLNQMPGNCFNFPDFGDCPKINQETLDLIRDQLSNAWCQCEAEDCSTAGIDENITFDSVTFSEAPWSGGELINPVDPATASQGTIAMSNYRSAINDWSTNRRIAYFRQQELDIAQDRLVEVNDRLAELLALPPPLTQAQVDEINDLFAEQQDLQDEINFITPILNQAIADRDQARMDIDTHRATVLSLNPSNLAFPPTNPAYAAARDLDDALAGCGDDLCLVTFSIGERRISSGVEYVTRLTTVFGNSGDPPVSQTIETEVWPDSTVVTKGFGSGIFDPFTGEAVGFMNAFKRPFAHSPAQTEYEAPPAGPAVYGRGNRSNEGGSSFTLVGGSSTYEYFYRITGPDPVDCGGGGPGGPGDGDGGDGPPPGAES